jgi:long-chain acyl-CoA synthetase
MNVLLKDREVGFHLGDSGAKALFVWHEFADAARAAAGQAGTELIEVEPAAFAERLAGVDPQPEVAGHAPDDTAVVLYTSGTTGTPKGAELTHDNLLDNARLTHDTLLDLTEQDVVLGALPLFHAFGQTCAMNAAVSVGALLTMLPRFEPGQALEVLQRDAVTVFEGVPTMYSALLHHPDRSTYDTSALRVCISGGAALPVEVLHAFDEAFGCTILEGYGLSETSPVASFNHPDKERKPGTIGTAVRGVELRLVDDDGQPVPEGEVGEIAIKGRNVMKGYWQREDATEQVLQDGWFRTGDMATVDDEGYYSIVDRKKDLIIRGGYNVYPREIEEVLYEHPAVLEAAVVGMKDPSLGEEVGAAVVLKEGEKADPEELKAYVKERVAAYKYPRRVWLLDALPKGATGKILKREIHVPDGSGS